MKSDGALEHMHVSRGCTWHVCSHCFLPSPSPYSIHDAPQAPADLEAWCFSKTQSEYKASVTSMTKQVGVLTAPEGQAFCVNRNVLQMQKEVSGVLRNINDQRTLLYSFLPVWLLCINQPLTLEIMAGRKEKIKPFTVPFPSAFPYSPVAQGGECVRHIHTSRSEVKAVDLVLRRVSILPVRMKYTCMNEPQNTNHVISVIPYAS